MRGQGLHPVGKSVPTSRSAAIFPTSSSRPVRDLARWWWGFQKPVLALTIISVGCIALLTLGVLLMYPRTYQSTAKLLLRPGRESVTVGPAVAAIGQAMPVQQTPQNETETALGVMHSRLLMQVVVDTVGAKSILNGELSVSDPSKEAPAHLVSRLSSKLKTWIGSLDQVDDSEKAVRRLGKHLSITAARDSSVIKIQYSAASPELAHKVVQTYVDAYVDKHGDFHRTPGTLKFFQTEQERLTEQLRLAHEALRTIKDESGLVTVIGQQSLLENELSTVRSKFNEVDGDLSASISKIDELRRQLASLDSRAILQESSGTSDSREAMRTRLFELEVLEQDLASRYTDTHPRLVSTRRQLSEARDILDSQTGQRDQVIRGINPTFQRIETELALENATRDSLSRKRVTVTAQLESLRREIGQLNQQSELIAQRTRNVEILETQYIAHSKRLEQARIENMLQQEHITSVREIQPASLERRPVSPNKLLCVIFGMTACLGAVVGIPMCFSPDTPQQQDESSVEAVPRSVTRSKDYTEQRPLPTTIVARVQP